MKVVIGLFVIVFSVFGYVRGISWDDLATEEWEAFKGQYEKTYENDVEEQFRKKIYMENRHLIATHNKDRYMPYKLGMNQYGDQLNHEFSKIMNGYRQDLKNGSTTTSGYKVTTFLAPAHFTAPDQIDWRSEGYVTPVKNQKQCGSCWAFSATGSLEGQVKRKTGKLASLSEQNLMDCSRKQGNHGCNGGLMDFAFEYVKQNGGIDTEECYPYLAKDASCHYDSSCSGADCTSHVDIPSEDEEQLLQAVASVGPISVAIDASQRSFQLYQSGVYDEPNCSSTQLDHGVLVVGYGTEGGRDYWLVKNSWGVGWGNEGYIKMARNRNNQCGIATVASYPLM